MLVNCSNFTSLGEIPVRDEWLVFTLGSLLNMPDIFRDFFFNKSLGTVLVLEEKLIVIAWTFTSFMFLDAQCYFGAKENILKEQLQEFP